MSQFLLTEKSAAGVISPSATKHVFFMDAITGHLMSKKSNGQLVEYKPLATTQELHSQFVTVGQSGDSVDFTSVKAAVDSITTADSLTRFAVLVYPGTFWELPFVVDPFTSLVTIGEKVTVLKALNANDDFIALGNNTALCGFDLEGPSNASCIDVSNGATNVYIEDSIAISGSTFLSVSGVGTQVFFEESKIRPSVATGVTVSASAFVGISSGFIRSVIGVKCDNAELALQNNYLGGMMTGTGIWALNNAKVRMGNTTISYRDVGVRAASGCDVKINGVIFSTNTIDLKQEDANAVISGSGISLNQDKIEYLKPSNIRITFLSDKFADEAFHVFSELCVGHAGSGRESVLGQGDSYTNGRVAYYFNGSTFSDVSIDLDEVNSGTVALGTATNNALYLASSIQDDTDYIQLTGLKLTSDTIASTGVGYYVIEYWNGSSWAETRYMVKDAQDKYLPRAETIFEQLQATNIRLGSAMHSDWVKNDPVAHGTDLFWIRIRVFSTISTAPIFKQIKLHANKTKVNKDGFLEYFGQGRPIARLPFDLGSFEAANNSPANIDSYLADNLSVGRQENSFQDGVTDRSGLNSYLPLDIDTSCPIKLQWTVQCTNSGDIQWQVRWASSKEGDSIYDTSGNAPTNAPNQKSLTFIQTIASDDTQNTISVDLDISPFLSEREGSFGDILWISIERQGNSGADTLTGNANLIQLIPFYTKCTEGGHQ